MSRLESWILKEFGKLRVGAVLVISLAIAILVGGVVPASLHLNRLFSGLYAVAGAVLFALPWMAKLVRQYELESRRLLLLRSGHAEGIGTLSYREFEHLIAAWYEARGYQVEIRGGSGDGGIDLLATRDGQKVAVQCKHWRKKEVGSPDIRNFRGSVMDSTTTLVLVCSGRVSEPARREAKEKRVELVEGPELVALLNGVIANSAPRCPSCGGEMRPKTGRRGDFWSCLAYPKCRGGLDIDAPMSPAVSTQSRVRPE